MNKNKLEYEFADDSPSKTKRSHRHRRGRGFATNRKSSASTNSSRSSSLSTQSLGHNAQRSSHQAAHLHADELSNNNTTNDHDQNSCAGSLTYSASSSVQSGSGAESSNDSSFADIIKLIDSDGDGSDLKKFIEKSSHAADSLSQMGMDENPVVTAWKERANERTRQQQQKAKQMKSKKQQFTMKSSPMPSSNVDLNYSKDDSSEDENIFGDLDDTFLETIAGLDDDRKSTSTAQHQPGPSVSSVGALNSARPTAPSSPGRSTTPPPNSRHKRTSTPPGAVSVTRTSSRGSRHSKSSSDGSFESPAPRSPPHDGSHTKPPHVRGTPTSSKTRRASTRENEDSSVENALSEAFYTKTWMCGFADAFSFQD